MAIGLGDGSASGMIRFNTVVNLSQYPLNRRLGGQEGQSRLFGKIPFDPVGN